MARILNTNGVDPIVSLDTGIVMNYAQEAAGCAVFYEYAITLSDEVALVWGGGGWVSKWLFLLNRYGTLVYALLEMLVVLPWNPIPSCKAYNVAYNFLGMIPVVAWVAFSCIRVYAISGWRHRWYLICLAATLGLAPVAILMYRVVTTRYVINEPGHNGDATACDYVSSLPPNTTKLYIMLSRSFSIASDALILAVTCIALVQPVRLGRLIGVHALTQVLLRDGIVYFMLLLLVNLGQIILWAVGSVHYGVFGALISSMTSIVISRMLLHMRSTQRDDDPEVSSLEHATAINPQTQLTEWRISVDAKAVGWQPDDSTFSSPEHWDREQPQTVERVSADDILDRMAV